VQDHPSRSPFWQAQHNVDWPEFIALLNDQERTVADLLTQGWRPSEIATELRLSRGRISQIRWSIVQKRLEYESGK
jgi:DNA-binding NarL/FixJ family response regulator